MQARAQRQSNDSPYQRAKHIGLGIPWIALGTEKLVGALAQCERRAPLDEFIARANRQHDADHDEGQHLAART
jgi:hypothetical protein